MVDSVDFCTSRGRCPAGFRPEFTAGSVSIPTLLAFVESVTFPARSFLDSEGVGDCPGAPGYPCAPSGPKTCRLNDYAPLSWHRIWTQISSPNAPSPAMGWQLNCHPNSEIGKLFWSKSLVRRRHRFFSSVPICVICGLNESSTEDTDEHRKTLPGIKNWTLSFPNAPSPAMG